VDGNSYPAVKRAVNTSLKVSSIISQLIIDDERSKTHSIIEKSRTLRLGVKYTKAEIREKKTEKLLWVLVLNVEIIDRKTETFSGGWRMMEMENYAIWAKVNFPLPVSNV